MHNIFKNRRHILPIYLTVVPINYLTKNTVTTDGFQSYEENRRLLLLIYAVILKLSTFLGVYTILEINCSFFCSFCVFIVFFYWFLRTICIRFFSFWRSTVADSNKKNTCTTLYSVQYMLYTSICYQCSKREVTYMKNQ